MEKLQIESGIVKRRQNRQSVCFVLKLLYKKVKKKINVRKCAENNGGAIFEKLEQLKIEDHSTGRS